MFTFKNNLFLTVSSDHWFIDTAGFFLYVCFVGERCTGRNNAFGTCKLIYECAQTIKDIKAGLGRVLCKTGEQIEVVCCVEANSQVTVTSLSAATPAVDVSTLRLADRSESIVPVFPTSPKYPSFQSVTSTPSTSIRMNHIRCSFPAQNPS